MAEFDYVENIQVTWIINPQFKEQPASMLHTKQPHARKYLTGKRQLKTTIFQRLPEQ